MISNDNIIAKKETGRIESIKHIEWMLLFYFIYHTLIQSPLNVSELLIFIVGSQFPDILEAFLFKVMDSPEKRRSLTHVPIIPIILIVLSLTITFDTSSLLYYFSVGFLGHLIIDMFAGGDPVYIFGFSRFGKLQIIDKEQRLKFGSLVYSKVGYLWEENTNADLAWFWVLQFFGSVLCALSFALYLQVVF